MIYRVFHLKKHNFVLPLINGTPCIVENNFIECSSTTSTINQVTTAVSLSGEPQSSEVTCLGHPVYIYIQGGAPHTRRSFYEKRLEFSNFFFRNIMQDQKGYNSKLFCNIQCVPKKSYISKLGFF